jgi:hypothetical protein
MGKSPRVFALRIGSDIFESSECWDAAEPIILFFYMRAFRYPELPKHPRYSPHGFGRGPRLTGSQFRFRNQDLMQGLESGLIAKLSSNRDKFQHRKTLCTPPRFAQF